MPWDTLKFVHQIHALHAQTLVQRVPGVMWSLDIPTASVPDTDTECVSVEAIQDGNGGYVRYLFAVYNHLLVWNWQNLCSDSLPSLQPQREELPPASLQNAAAIQGEL